ncbi:beta-lactamase domain protein [Desulfosarcina variabilis str. Montpellier]|uniref:MBL fold metallo-hydrolase n=1 Tax=Desulfosarcina variabilis TaxID=2300 RepID=UPI003AFA6D34
MQITSEIWQVGGEGFTSSQDAAIYLLCVEGWAAIVDAGCGGQVDRLAANIRACGVKSDQVDYLLLTHCHYDHVGGAEAVRTRFDCAIVAHEADATALESGDSRLTAATWYAATMSPLTVDVKLAGARSTIYLGTRSIEAIHTPGHTPGSVVYLMESEGQRVLFGQDVHGPLSEDFGSDSRAYKKSLEHMLDLEADILCEGHFGVYRGKDEVRRFIGSFL